MTGDAGGGPTSGDITSWAPSEWFTNPATSSIWITAYMTALVPSATGTRRPLVVDLPRARVVLFDGTLTYFDAGGAGLQPGEDGSLTASFEPQEKTTPRGVYAVVILPFDVDGTAGDEPATRSKVATIAGLIGALVGRIAVFRKLYDNVREMSGSRTTAFSAAMLNPGSLSLPRIDASRVDLLRTVGGAAFISDSGGARLQLSLRWFDASIQSDDNVDSFIRCWIALETLAMPDTTNIAPINDALAVGYGLSIDAVRDRFRVGRLYGLRGDIVHGGSPTALNAAVDEYLRAIFIDTLVSLEGLPNEQRSEQIRTASAVALREYLGYDFGAP